MFCCPCISIYVCSETNWMHSVYSVTIPVHVSGLLVAHQQQVTTYICDNLYVLYILVDRWPANSRLRRTTSTDWPANIQLRHKTHAYCHIYILLPPVDGLLGSPKHVEV
jgi:hypothetical protein